MMAALTRMEERHLVLDYLLGIPVKTLAINYGIHRATIYHILARHDVTPDRKGS